MVELVRRGAVRSRRRSSDEGVASCSWKPSICRDDHWGMVTSAIHVLIFTPVVFYLMKACALHEGTRPGMRATRSSRDATNSSNKAWCRSHREPSRLGTGVLPGLAACFAARTAAVEFMRRTPCGDRDLEDWRGRSRGQSDRAVPADARFASDHLALELRGEQASFERVSNILAQRQSGWLDHRIRRGQSLYQRANRLRGA